MGGCSHGVRVGGWVGGDGDIFLGRRSPHSLVLRPRKQPVELCWDIVARLFNLFFFIWLFVDSSESCKRIAFEQSKIIHK